MQRRCNFCVREPDEIETASMEIETCTIETETASMAAHYLYTNRHVSVSVMISLHYISLPLISAYYTHTHIHAFRNIARTVTVTSHQIPVFVFYIKPMITTYFPEWLTLFKKPNPRSSPGEINHLHWDVNMVTCRGLSSCECNLSKCGCDGPKS